MITVVRKSNTKGGNEMRSKEQMDGEFRSVYAEKDDMTFIVKEVWGESTEVVGFYYGEPNDDLTKLFTGRLKAEF